MSVFVSIEDNDGEPLVDVFEVDQVFRRFPEVPGTCVRFICEAEDASFNAKQSPMLLAELESLDKPDLDPASKKELTRILSACKKHAGRHHVYIRFYGEEKSQE